MVFAHFSFEFGINSNTKRHTIDLSPGQSSGIPLKHWSFNYFMFILLLDRIFWKFSTLLRILPGSLAVSNCDI